MPPGISLLKSIFCIFHFRLPFRTISFHRCFLFVFTVFQEGGRPMMPKAGKERIFTYSIYYDCVAFLVGKHRERVWGMTSCSMLHLLQFSSSDPLSQSSLPSQCQLWGIHLCRGGPQLSCVAEQVLFTAIETGSKKKMWKLKDKAIKAVFAQPSIKLLLLYMCVFTVVR